MPTLLRKIVMIIVGFKSYSIVLILFVHYFIELYHIHTIIMTFYEKVIEYGGYWLKTTKKMGDIILFCRCPSANLITSSNQLFLIFQYGKE